MICHKFREDLRELNRNTFKIKNFIIVDNFFL